jgi:hypothetical protein
MIARIDDDHLHKLELGHNWEYSLEKGKGNRNPGPLTPWLIRDGFEPVSAETQPVWMGPDSPEHRSVRNLSESEQAALFLEFLRWKEQQSAVNSNAAAESLRGTISP